MPSKDGGEDRERSDAVPARDTASAADAALLTEGGFEADPPGVCDLRTVGPCTVPNTKCAIPTTSPCGVPNAGALTVDDNGSPLLDGVDSSPGPAASRARSWAST